MKKILTLSGIALLAALVCLTPGCQNPVKAEPLYGSVTIAGNPWVDETLTANTWNLSGSGDIFYHWKRDGVIVEDWVNRGTYLLTQADRGKMISVTVVRFDNTGSVTSAPTSTIVLPPPQGTITIDGTVWVGNTLTANTRQFINAKGPISCSWARIRNNTTTNLGTGSSYTVQSADIGSSIRLTVTSEGTSGSLTATTITVPEPIVTISGGEALVGQRLTATDNYPTSGSPTYQWRRNGVPISGATNSSYTIQIADIGTNISVSVTRHGYSAISTPTNIVPQPAVTISPATAPLVGSALTASVTNVAYGVSVSYQWRRGGSNISGATGSTYTVQSADAGYTISVTATVNSSSFTSASTAIVPQPGIRITPSNAMVGQRLTAEVDNLGGSGTLSYQWRRGSAGATVGTGSDYTVQFTDVGYTITVTVTRGSFSAASTPTNTVPQPAVTISPTTTPLVGSTLTPSVSNLASGVSVSYQWRRGSSTNIGAGNTYTVQCADAGYAITATATVTFTGISGGGNTITSSQTNTVPQPAITISGSAMIGSTLTASISNIASGVTVSYQWMSGYYSIYNATSSSYTVRFDDAGNSLSVIAYLTFSGNPGYCEISSNYSTSTVPTPLLNITPATGTVSVGTMLTANITNLTAGGVSVSYQWRRGSSTNIGTGSAYTVQTADAGYTIYVTATVTITGTSFQYTYTASKVVSSP